MNIHNMENLFLFAKDKNLRYTQCNEGMANILGLDSPSQVIGKSDYDLLWKDNADLYRGRDGIIISKNIHQHGLIEPQKQANGQSSIAITKTPIQGRDSEIQGIVGFFTNVKNPSPGNADFQLLPDGKFCLGVFFGNAILSHREFSILKEILNGVPAANSAEKYNIKKNTYNTFTERLKQKMGCSSKSDIIVSSVQSGLVHFLQNSKHLTTKRLC